MKEYLYSIEYINRFLAGAMDKTEEEEMIEGMKQDSGLKDRVEEQLKIRTATYYLGRQSWITAKDQELDHMLAASQKRKLRLLLSLTVAGILVIMAFDLYKQRARN